MAQKSDKICLVCGHLMPSLLERTLYPDHMCPCDRLIQIVFIQCCSHDCWGLLHTKSDNPRMYSWSHPSIVNILPWLLPVYHLCSTVKSAHTTLLFIHHWSISWSSTVRFFFFFFLFNPLNSADGEISPACFCILTDGNSRCQNTQTVPVLDLVRPIIFHPAPLLFR